MQAKTSPCWIEACVYNCSVPSVQWWKKNASDLLSLFFKNSHLLHFNFTLSLIDPIDSFQIIELWWLLTLYLLWDPCMESISIKLYFMCFILLESFKHSVICCGENSVYKGTYDSLSLLLFTTFKPLFLLFFSVSLSSFFGWFIVWWALLFL